MGKGPKKVVLSLVNCNNVKSRKWKGKMWRRKKEKNDHMRLPISRLSHQAPFDISDNFGQHKYKEVGYLDTHCIDSTGKSLISKIYF